MLLGVTDRWYLNTETVLGNGAMTSFSRAKCQVVPNIPECRLPLHLYKAPCMLLHYMDEY